MAPDLATPAQTQAWLRKHRWLRLHVALIAAACLGCLMAVGALLRLLGVHSLGLRYALSLPLSYLAYLGLLRLWAAYLLDRSEPASVSAGDGVDAVDLASAVDLGDVGVGLGRVAGAALEGAASADEGALVLVPLAAVVAVVVGLAVVLGAGMTWLFGVDILLAVAVEVALASVAGGIAWRHAPQFGRDGWLMCALGHTWRGALLIWVAGVGIGAALDHWMPGVESLPQAIQHWRSH
jgi:hypothetical protein